jgi:hypothetical protein
MLAPVFQIHPLNLSGHGDPGAVHYFKLTLGEPKFADLCLWLRETSGGARVSLWWAA